MSNIEGLKHRLIDRIKTSQDENLLVAIESILTGDRESSLVQLTQSQIDLLMLSENDIAMGNLVSEEELLREDAKWMN